MNRRNFLFTPALLTGKVALSATQQRAAGSARQRADSWWTTNNPEDREVIRIDHGTTEWVEALPLGNGDLGVCLYGGPERITMLFNKSNVWDYRVGPGQGFPDNITFDQLVELINRRDWAKADPVFAGFRKAENCSSPSLQSCGQLDLELLTGERPLNFFQQLDLNRATASIHADFTEYLAGRQAIDLRTLVPARGTVIPVWLANVPGYKLFGVLRLWRALNLDFAPPVAWVDGDIAGLNMTIPASVKYTLAVRVVNGAGEWINTASQAMFTFRPEQENALLLVTIVSSFEDQNTSRAAVNSLRSMDAGAAAEIEQEHRTWWRGYWGRSSVNLPDARLERLWRTGMYFMGSSSQPGKQAMGLQGIWNGYNRPGWHTDYHTDMNVQMCFWPAYAGNQLELTEPYYRLFAKEMTEQARLQAKRFFRRRGEYIPLAPGPHGHELAAPWMWPFGGAWVAQHYWWHYLYTGDVGFLRQYYPFLKEVGLFCEEFMKKSAGGKYEIIPSHCPEMSHPGKPLLRAWAKNSTPDLTYSRTLFTALIKTSELLGVDAADRKRWQEIRDNLAPYPMLDGRLAPVEDPEFQKARPGVMVLSPIFPVGEFGLGSSTEQLTMARRSFEAAKARSGGHATVWSAAAAAQLGLGEEAVRLLNRYIELWVLENGFYLLGPDLRPRGQTKGIMQVDAPIAFSMAVIQMLLHSLDGVIRVFPAVPRDWTAEFRTLRATGAFLVSARMEKGRTQWVRLLSERGGQAAVQDPFGTGAATLGSAGGERALRAGANNVFRFETARGETYSLKP
jgi:hypothetical protein